LFNDLENDTYNYILNINDFENKVLIACEESQVVTLEMRRLGIEAYSCDLEESSGDYPEWHIQCDVIDLLKYNWKLIIAFPPCTHIAASGARWFDSKKQEQIEAINFFMTFANLQCRKIAIENPVGIMSNLYRKPDQIIHPWMFGHNLSKATCLWLRNLPHLKPTNIVEVTEDTLYNNIPNIKERGKLRSKTFIGIATAMAHQWGLL
jgi:hypothetical protein